MRKEKYCPVCKTIKPGTEFYRNKSKKDGISSECKICMKIATAKFSKSDRGKEYIYNYRRTDKGKACQRKYCQSEKGRKFRREYDNKWKKTHRAHIKAQSVVSNAVATGKLPHISTHTCTYCPKQAEDYHHHLGYAKKHWFNIEPVCRLCHKKIHRLLC